MHEYTNNSKLVLDMIITHKEFIEIRTSRWAIKVKPSMVSTISHFL